MRSLLTLRLRSFRGLRRGNIAPTLHPPMVNFFITETLAIAGMSTDRKLGAWCVQWLAERLHDQHDRLNRLIHTAETPA